MLFTRRLVTAMPHMILDGQTIQPSFTVTYLGLKLDPKLRWVPHFQYLKGIISRWGLHPSCLQTIFNAVIRSKADFDSFFFASASLTHRKQLNSILSSCLRTIIGVTRSSPLVSLEVECACPPIELKSRRLAGKFLFKCLSSSNYTLYQMFVSIKNIWTYVPKTLPILASIVFSFTDFTPLIYRSSLRLPIYDTPLPSTFIFT